MKRWILFLVSILIALISYKVLPVLASEDEDSLEIQRVISKFYDGFALRDIDSMMKEVSSNYNGIDKDGQPIDYAKLKSILEGDIKRMVNISISDLKIANLNVQNNKATLELEFTRKGFDVETTEDLETKEGRVVTLVKEDGSWKILQLHRKYGAGPRPQPKKTKP